MKHFFVLLLFVGSLPLFGQTPIEDPSLYAGITPEMLQTTSYDSFPGAEAVYLWYEGEAEPADYTNASVGIRTVYRIRLHILKSGGLKFANFDKSFFPSQHDIVLYHGATHNLVNGEIESSMVTQEDVTIEKVDDEISVFRINFPQVRVGSIIDLRFSFRQNSSFSYQWYFQKELPVLNAVFKFIPRKNYTYAEFRQGMHFDRLLRTEDHYWLMRNLPRTPDESFVSNVDDFRPKMMYQLQEIYSYGLNKEVMEDWEKVNKYLHQSDELMTYYAPNRTLFRNLLDSRRTKNEAYLKDIYTRVQQDLLWDGEDYWAGEGKLRPLVKKGSGNRGEINLVLVNQLRTAGFKAQPMLLSTVDHGKVYKDYPILSQFNALICYVELGEKVFFLDATNRYRPYLLPPLDAMEVEGLLIHNKGPRWVQVSSDHASIADHLGIFKLDAEGFVKGSFREKNRGFGTVGLRRLRESETEDFAYLKDVYDFSLEEDQVTSIQVENVEQLSEDLVIRFEVETDEYTDIHGDRMYFNPLLFTQGWESNPFSAEERTLPINFPTSQKNIYNLSFALPSGYEVEALPKNIKIRFGEDDFVFVYACQSNGFALQFQIRYEINRTQFPPEDYPQLRDLFDQMITQLNETIVLKKVVQN
ncbi:MAG: hypothetical protein AAFR61_01615 [Bacteroidota bacterium]